MYRPRKRALRCRGRATFRRRRRCRTERTVPLDESRVGETGRAQRPRRGRQPRSRSRSRGSRLSRSRLEPRPAPVPQPLTDCSCERSTRCACRRTPVLVETRRSQRRRSSGPLCPRCQRCGTGLVERWPRRPFESRVRISFQLPPARDRAHPGSAASLHRRRPGADRRIEAGRPTRRAHERAPSSLSRGEATQRPGQHR